MKYIVIVFLISFSFLHIALAQESQDLFVVPSPSNIPIYKPPLDKARTFYEALLDADAIAHVRISSAEEHKTVDRVGESFAVLKMSGTVATPRGVQNIPSQFKIRAPLRWSRSVNTEWILFIQGNRLEHDPIRRRLRVKDGIVYHHAQTTRPIISMSETGHLEVMPSFNTCDISEYHERYNPNEDLDLVLDFTCADGSQWTRGNDRPADYVEQTITPQYLMEQASNYLNRHNLPAPDLSAGIGEIDDTRPLNMQNQLSEWNELRDNMKRRFMELFDDETWKKVYKIHPKDDIRMQEFVKRELARGKSISELPLRSRGVLPYIEIPEDSRNEGNTKKSIRR